MPIYISKTKPSLSLPSFFFIIAASLICPSNEVPLIICHFLALFSDLPDSYRVCMLVLVRSKAQFLVAGFNPDTGLHSMETFSPFWCYFLNTGKAPEGSPSDYFSIDGIHGLLFLQLLLLLLLCFAWLPPHGGNGGSAPQLLFSTLVAGRQQQQLYS